MPYKNVSQPRKVAQLEGEVTGASYHRKLDSVAMVATNPCQVCVVARSGNPSKVFAVSLGDVSDIALLSRDMAVVQEGAVAWGLLDIAHKVKVDQIASDIRMIVGPQGDSALALKWDNAADQLTPGKGDITVRSFGLRGDHRAVSVGDAECYAVVDGGDGEFRIHAGATPEAGSTAKTALPPGCRDLNRLSGGRFLSALYSRGDNSVCVIKRAGNRLEPKLLKLDIPVADVAVSETSLIAIARDGRVVLYDSAAIDAASSSLIEPKASLSLGCSGEPRIVLIAAGSVFVGTSAGEVFSAVLVRKQLMQ